MTTMRAWRMSRTGEPLALVNVAVPDAMDDEVKIRIRAAGICHTDVGILDDPMWMDRIGNFPLTLGHEVAGEVVAVGADVTGWEVGTRVAINPAGDRSKPGIGRDGGYSAYCTAYPEDLVRIPEGLSFELAAAGTDAGRAPYRAVVVRGAVQPGEKVGIIGLGGLGQVGARIAVLQGAEVYVAEPKRALWQTARDLGAVDVADDILAFRDVGLDLIVDFAGFGITTAGAIEAIGDFGRIVQVGMGRLQSLIPTDELIFKQATIMGSRGGSNEDIAAVYEMCARGDLSPHLEIIDFDDIPSAIDRLRTGGVTGRLVARF